MNGELRTFFGWVEVFFLFYKHLLAIIQPFKITIHPRRYYSTNGNKAFEIISIGQIKTLVGIVQDIKSS